MDNTQLDATARQMIAHDVAAEYLKTYGDMTLREFVESTEYSVEIQNTDIR